MAEAIALSLFTQPDFRIEWIESGGTLGIDGQPAAENAIKAVGEWGLDLSAHRSQGISANHLDEADYIVAMAPDHVREIWMRRPAAESRIVRLWTFTTRKGRLNRIDDPIGQPYEVYLAARDDISECLHNWIKTLPGNAPTDSD
jgi:protein-tyrosine-phosphatase